MPAALSRPGACTPRQSGEVRTSDEGTYSSVTSLPLGERTHTTRRLRSSPLQRLERDHLAHTQLQRIGHRLQALN